MNKIQEIERKIKTIIYIDKSRVFGGAEECLNSLITSLDRNKFESFLCLDFPLSHQELFNLEKTNVCYRTKKKQIWLKESWNRSPPAGTGHLERFIYAFKLLFFIKKIKPVIIHLNLYRKLSYLDLLISKYTKTIVVAHVRSLASQVELSSTSLNLCDAIICTSDAVKKDVQAISPRGIARRIYDGIDIEKYRFDGTQQDARQLLNLPLNNQIISSVAILDSRKGHDVAIRCLPQILIKNHNVLLVIAGAELKQGTFTETQRLKKIADGLNVLKHVKFLGHCRNITALYAASDIILALSKDGEAFGRVPLEAAIAKRPIVATAMGATKEIVVDNETGFLVKPNDSFSVVAKVLDVLKTPQNYWNLLDNAEKRAKQLFDSRDCNSEIQNLYLELIRKKNST
jgi:glycosyltransferase involved in cell wall biosynthesis